MKLNLETSIREVTKDLWRLADKDVKRASRSGINRSLTAGRTDLSKQVRNEKRVKASAIKRRVKLNKARLSSLSGDMRLTSRRLGLDNFRFRQTRSGVSVRMQKGGVTKVRSAFVAKIGGKNLVLARGRYDGSGGFNWKDQRLPITRLQTFSITAVANKAPVRNAIAERMQDVFLRRFEQQLARFRNR